MEPAEQLIAASRRLCRALARMRFSAPVSHVYNPLTYARAPYEAYVRRYATGPKRVLFFGMNPGPYGMTQTGVPFGEVAHVRDWLGIEEEVKMPAKEHPRRAILGFACPRSEVSGARFWGLWRTSYGTPDRFFSWAFVANYCPLVFMEESGRNLTPDKLPMRERAPLLAACDEHLRAVLSALTPAWVVGVGSFAESRARAVVAQEKIAVQPRVASIPHPSPASPLANRDWAGSALAALKAQGVPIDPPQVGLR